MKKTRGESGSKLEAGEKSRKLEEEIGRGAKRENCTKGPPYHTPRRPPKRTPLRVRDQQQQVERRRLSYEAEPKSGPSPWTEEEIKALVEFILFYEKDNKWPSHKRSEYWKGAGRFIQIRCRCSQRSGK